MSNFFKYLILFSLIINLQNTQAQDKPNIIILIAEDLRYDELAFLNKAPVLTPNIDKLAAQSTVFTEAYTTSPVCPISRAGIFTGLNVPQHGITHYKSKLPKNLWQQSYPVLLRQEGYKTGFIGNWGINVWNRSDRPKNDFDAWYGFWFSWGDYDEHDIDGRPVHVSKLIENQMVRFLNNYKQDPFCLSVSFKSPQLPWQHDPAHDDLFTDTDIRFPETYQQKPEPAKAYTGNLFDCENISAKITDLEAYQDTIRDRYRLIYGLDMVVGRLMHELEVLGLQDNTIIILMSDNGFLLGEHALWGKSWAYQEALRIPLLVYDPSQKAQNLSVNALNIDVMPTILDYAGLKAPNNLKGQSLKANIEGQGKQLRETITFYQPYTRESESDSWGNFPACSGLIKGDLKYIYFHATEAEALFDLSKDPKETRNVATDRKYKKQLQMMREAYKEQVTR